MKFLMRQLSQNFKKNISGLEAERNEWWLDLKNIILSYWKSNMREIQEIAEEKIHGTNSHAQDHEVALIRELLRCQLPLFNWHMEKFEFIENFSVPPATASEESSQGGSRI